MTYNQIHELCYRINHYDYLIALCEVCLVGWDFVDNQIKQTRQQYIDEQKILIWRLVDEV